ncbi:MAG: proton-conducting transporter membrane subunit, partial [Candidatus Bathyarchaeota archaeon]|nr:proton-conducting transporter membrane subunit [Candidatus Bathyarchaeota archaeon]
MFSKVQSRFRHYLAAASVGIGALFSFSMIPDILAGNILDWRISWFHLELGVLVDPLSVLMACVVNGIGLLVAVFSIEYMRRDPSLSRYWFLIQLFIGGLVLIVVADNLLLLFIGWEIVGVSCSALVAFWHQDPEKAHYGLKTFLVLRVGDILLLTSILIIYANSNTFSLYDLRQDARWIVDLSTSGLLLITVMMLFGGAIAKSALFPLHVWLPDALPASPASFNALTEVLAGAFLVARFLPMLQPLTVEYVELAVLFSTVAWIGAFTALLAALMAMVERNVIRVLVYSIISQYAFVMIGLGVGGLMENPTMGYIAANMHL